MQNSSKILVLDLTTLCQDLSKWLNVNGLLKKPSLICQSVWKEWISNTRPVICCIESVGDTAEQRSQIRLHRQSLHALHIKENLQFTVISTLNFIEENTDHYKFEESVAWYQIKIKVQALIPNISPCKLFHCTHPIKITVRLLSHVLLLHTPI